MKTIKQIREYFKDKSVSWHDAININTYLNAKEILGDLSIPMSGNPVQFVDFVLWFEAETEIKPIIERYPLTYQKCLNKNSNKKLYYMQSSTGVISINTEQSRSCFNYAHTEKIAKAMSVLNQLIFICNEWNKIDNFTPTFGDNICNHTIWLSSNKWYICTLRKDNQIFSFKTAATAEKFLETQKDLLEQVKPLFHC